MSERLILRTNDATVRQSTLQHWVKSWGGPLLHPQQIDYYGQVEDDTRIYALSVDAAFAARIKGEMSRLPGFTVTRDVRLRNVPVPSGDGRRTTGQAEPTTPGDLPTGKGIGIAVLDLEGVNEHDAFSGRLVRYDLRNGELEKAGASTPLSNHGTLVAGVAGGGQPCGSSAREATIVGVRVSGWALDLEIAMTRVHQQHPEVRVFCIAMDSDKDDPVTPGDERVHLHRLIAKLWRRGVVTCVSAGNEGKNLPIQSPATAELALTIGGFDSHGDTVDTNDIVHALSSRGEAGALTVKPTFMEWWGPRLSAKVTQDANGQLRSDFDDVQGTSCSVGYASGLVAGWLSAVPDLTPEMLESVLVRDDVYRKVPETKNESSPAAPNVGGKGIVNPSRVLEELKKLATAEKPPRLHQPKVPGESWRPLTR